MPRVNGYSPGLPSLTAGSKPGGRSGPYTGSTGSPDSDWRPMSPRIGGRLLPALVTGVIDPAWHTLGHASTPGRWGCFAAAHRRWTAWPWSLTGEVVPM